MQIRFKLKKRLTRIIYILSLVFSNMINFFDLTFTILTVLVVINLELVWWRNKFFK